MEDSSKHMMPVPRPRAPRSKPAPKGITAPTRRSSRLSGASLPEDSNKRNADELDRFITTNDRSVKKTRHSEDVSLGNIPLWEDGGSQMPIRGAEPGVRTFDHEVPLSTDQGVKDLRGRMDKLVFYDKYEVKDMKITPQRIYSMGFHPMEEKTIIFAGDKEGHLGMFDATAADASQDEKPNMHQWNIHAGTISSVNFPLYNPKIVYTASYDNSVRQVDLEKGKSVELWSPQNPNDAEVAVSCMDLPADNPHLIFFSSLSGSLCRYDTRVEKRDVEIFDLHDAKIGGFSLDPMNPHMLATSSLDRTIKVWDLRSIKGSGDLRRPRLMGEHESRLSVSHVSWNRSGKVATSSYDNTVKVYDFSDAKEWATDYDIPDSQMKPAHTIPHNNQTGRWVTILKPQWQRNTQIGPQKFAIGNMNRFVDVYAENGEQVAQLEGDGITAVPAVAHFHPTKDIVCGGNSSGKLCLWMEGVDQGDDVNDEEPKKEEDDN